MDADGQHKIIDVNKIIKKIKKIYIVVGSRKKKNNYENFLTGQKLNFERYFLWPESIKWKSLKFL